MITASRLGVALLFRLLFAAGPALTCLPLRGESPAIPTRVLRAGVETHSEPFTGADSQGRPIGFAVDLLQSVARDQGLAIEFVALPWTELLDGFKAGRIDIICNVVDTPERRSFMWFSVTTALLQGSLFVRQDLPPIRTSADLVGRRLAVPKDSRAHQYVQHQNWKMQLVFVPTLQDAIDAVHDGRSDVFLATQLVSRDLIQRRGYRDIIVSELSFSGFDYREHFGVQPEQSALLASLNNGLLNMHADGTYDRLYERWLGPLQPRSLRFTDLRPYLLPIAALVLLVALAFVWQRRVLRQVSRQAEKLRLSEERLSLVFEGSQDGFWDWDARANQIKRSPHWASMLGYTLAEIGPTRGDFVNLCHPDDRAMLLSDEREIQQGRDHFMLEFRLRAKAGEWKWILDRGKIVARDPVTHAPLRLTGTHSDITARKLAEQETARLQSKMIETQKLESLGVLAGGIAHDFNNLLTVILGNTALTRLEATLSSANDERLEKIQTASRRAADLCRQLLAYAGKGNYAIGRLDLNALVRETTGLLELSLSRQAKLDFALVDSLPLIEADAAQIQQVVMNLVLNASEALGGSPGSIRIVTRVTRIGPGGLPRGLPSSELTTGDYVCLEISDTGCGMTAPVLERIFDPFYTTKFTGRGLGLAAVLGIVRSHDGALTVASEPGRGSVFQVYLPALAAMVEKSARPVALAKAERPEGTVLVVDDEEPVRLIVIQVLQAHGYVAIGAADGPAALEIFQASPDRFTVALIDLTLPGLDGPAILRAMKELRPGFPGIIMSGYSEPDARRAFADCGAVDFIQKPFTLDVLFLKIARARNLAG